jgi:hypothetical protein
MDRRAVAIVLAGIAIVAISVLADPIGLGGEAGFGWKQAVGAGAGAVLVVAGALVAIRARGAAKQPPVELRMR